jgi:hypothetical protein
VITPLASLAPRPAIFWALIVLELAEQSAACPHNPVVHLPPFSAAAGKILPQSLQTLLQPKPLSDKILRPQTPKEYIPSTGP